MALRTVQFLAIIFTALAMVPAGAHLFELPNKIGLDQAQYFIVQNSYRGWALFGIVLFGALLLNLVLAVMLRGQRTPLYFAPENWQALRTQWEYAHAVNAVITFASFCLLTLSVLSTPVLSTRR